MTSYTISPAAYHLLLLHAQKYLCSITGLLLGTKDSNTVTITQILPLAHSDLTIHTTALTETGLHLSEHYATSKGLTIVGAYFANDVLEDSTLPTAIVRLAGKVRERFHEACLLRLDGRKLERGVRTREHCIVVHIGRGWKPVVMTDLVGKDALDKVDTALSLDGVADLEDHLLDPRSDWLNGEVLKALERL